jgi:hypothetical protein
VLQFLGRLVLVLLAPMVGIGKDPGIGEVNGVRGMSRIGGGSRVVVI